METTINAHNLAMAKMELDAALCHPTVHPQLEARRTRVAKLEAVVAQEAACGHELRNIYAE